MEKTIVTAVTTTYWWSSFGARLFCWFYCFGPLGIRIRGLENVPTEGAVIIAANHMSYVDVMLLGGFIRSRHVCFAARASLGRNRLMAKVLEGCGCVPVVTDGTDATNRQAQSDMIAHLKAGDALVLLPEGTRSPDGKVKPFKPGAAVMAKRTGTTVIPVGIRGTYWVWPKGRAFPLPGFVSLEFGSPIKPDQFAKSRDLANRIEAIVCELAHQEPSTSHTKDELVA